MTGTPNALPIITAQTLRNLLMCARRPWLDWHGDPVLRDEVSLETARLFEIGNQHEQAIHAATVGPVEPVTVESWAEGVRVTRDLMRQQVPVILGGYLEYSGPLDLSPREFNVRGRADQLIRVRQHGEWLYAPIEIKARANSTPADWVQLDLYVWLLAQMQGRTPPAELWLSADSNGRPRSRWTHRYDEDRLLDALAGAVALLDQPDAPPVYMASHCKHCPWYSACREVARREGQIELLYNVPRKTCDALKRAGLATLAQVAAVPPDDLQKVKGIGPVTAPVIRANAQAWVEDRPVRFAPLPDVCRRDGWMFDLETLGEGIPWCLGWCDTQGRTRIALVAPVTRPQTLYLPDGQPVTLAPDPGAAWEAFADSVAAHDGPIFHWTGYDAAILDRTAPPDVKAALAPRLHDLHRTLTRTVSLPLGSTSIKTVSTYLGYSWPGYQDWFAAYEDYRRWLQTGDSDVLAQACTYQRADVESMAWVWRWLVSEA
ncbi:MAG: TM0106 family RecB-like putative nuclease [Chloroflexi bacterium]|nr:TM0106 family RecB-like putative nuclease [Chloroflexota bacterium]